MKIISICTALLLLSSASEGGNIPTLANWQSQRDEGLKHLEQIIPDVMSVNARVVTPLTETYNSKLNSLQSLKTLTADKDLEAVVILRGNNIVYEYYDDDFGPSYLHSAQSTTKPISVLLLAKAIKAGKISTEDKLEKHIPEIGSGFRGRTLKDVMSMNVLHEFNEDVAYTAADDSRLGQLRIRDEISFGYIPAKANQLITRREFAQQLKPLNKNGSNENKSGNLYYATINTEVAGWALERAMGKPLSLQVREIMHEIGGENTVHMTLDHVGTPMIGAGLVFTARDFARYGMLLRDSEYIQTIKYIPGTHVSESETYSHSLEISDYGYGHGGWGGQYIFADPESDIVVAIFGGIKGPDPIKAEYFSKVGESIEEVVSYYRNISKANP
ncbi:serine hydrolase [Dasania marina]|uniref:serine hydrolase n=1 Tax=Dasania marina TaxID=471499 RepID=UPI0030D86ECB